MTFYVQTWEEYYTHTLTLGLVSGPVEGIMTLVIVFALTAFLGGAHVWQQSALQTMGFAKHDFIPRELYDLPFTKIFMFYGGVVLVYNTLSRYATSNISPPSLFLLSRLVATTPFTDLRSCLNVARARRSRNEPVESALAGVAPFLTMWALIALYLFLQPDILHHHLVPFIFYVGLINAYSVGQIITAHLVKSEFPYQNVLVWPLAAGVVDSLGPFLSRYIGIGWPSALGHAESTGLVGSIVGNGNGAGAGVYQVAFVFLCLGLAVGVYGSFVVSLSPNHLVLFVPLSEPLFLLFIVSVLVHLFPRTSPSILKLSFSTPPNSIPESSIKLMEIIKIGRRHRRHLRLSRHLVPHHQAPVRAQDRRTRSVSSIWRRWWRR